MNKQFLLVFFLLTALGVQAQKEKAVIKTSMVCEMCKDRIEKSLVEMDGIFSVYADVPTKEVIVKYDTEVLDLDDILVAITKIGYDADALSADPVAYDRLHGCCKKDAVH